jgi:hypothetical protein
MDICDMLHHPTQDLAFQYSFQSCTFLTPFVVLFRRFAFIKTHKQPICQA